MPRGTRRGRREGAVTSCATGEERQAFEGESSNPQASINMEEQLFSRIAQRLAASMESVQGDPEKKFEIERFKSLGAQVFEGTTDPAGAEAWLN